MKTPTNGRVCKLGRATPLAWASAAACVIIGLAGCAKQEQKRTASDADKGPPAAASPLLPSAGPSDSIFAWCWSPPASALKNLVPMVWARNRDYSTPGTAALASRALPNGRAALFLWNAAPQLLADSLDTCRAPDGRPTSYPSPWLSAGAKEIAKRMALFFRRFKAAGGRMNYLVLDYEAGLTSWQITLSDMKAIERDPRSKALEKQLGFPYLSSVFFAGPNRRAWNLMMGRRVADALNTALFDPARASFPTVSGSNFGGADMAEPYIVPDPNDHYQALSSVFGNCQSPAFYGKIGGLAYTDKDGRPYGNSAFAVLRYEMMYLQGVQHSSNLPIVPWVAYPSYAKTAGYYKELIYQLVLRGVNRFLYWNPRQLNGQPAAGPRDDRRLNRCLATVKQKLGTRPGAPTASKLLNWNSNVLVAARRDTDGRVLYRLTVPPGTRSITLLPSRRKLNVRNKTGLWVLAGPRPDLSFRIGH